MSDRKGECKFEAYGSEDDKISRDAHNATRQLILQLFERVTDPDSQAAVLSGVAAALVEVCWIGRKPGLDVRDIKRLWKELGASYIEQAPAAYRIYEQ